MEVIIKLNAQSAGRDKLFRLFQYLCRLLWHRLEKSNINNFDRIKALEYTLGTFRKLLRFGRCVDTLYTTLPLLHYPDKTIRHTVVLSKISNALFLFSDHVVWLGRSGYFEVNLEKWSQRANKYWLCSIVMNLARDFYEIQQILKTSRPAPCPLRNAREVVEASKRALKCMQGNKAVFVDTVRNGCDLFIPLTALGYVKLSPSTTGLLGVISSAAGIIALVEPVAKLTPC